MRFDQMDATTLRGKIVEKVAERTGTFKLVYQPTVAPPPEHIEGSGRVESVTVRGTTYRNLADGINTLLDALDAGDRQREHVASMRGRQLEFEVTYDRAKDAFDIPAINP